MPDCVADRKQEVNGHREKCSKSSGFQDQSVITIVAGRFFLWIDLFTISSSFSVKRFIFSIEMGHVVEIAPSGLLLLGGGS